MRIIPTKIQVFEFLAVPAFVWLRLAGLTAGVGVEVEYEAKPPREEPPGPDDGCAA